MNIKLKNNKYLVSIIVPIFNVENYLNQCLLSILNQTYKNIEIICVDDGSTDNSFEIAKKYSKLDKRFKIYKKNNGGLSSARNYGIKLSKGEYIVFVDSDDYVCKRYVETLLSKLINNKCDTCICSYYVIDDLNNQLVSNNYYKIQDKVLNKYDLWRNEYLNIYPQFTVFCIYCAWNKIYKKDFLIKNQFLNKIHEDEYMSVFLFHYCNKILITNEKLYYYRINRKNSIIYNLNKAKNRSIFIPEVLKFRYIFFKKNKYPVEIKIYAANAFINSYIENIRFANKTTVFIYTLLLSLKIMFKARTKYNVKLVLKLIYKSIKKFFIGRKI